MAKRRLRAELKVVGRPLVSTQLLVREGFTRKEIINQSDTAIYEIAGVLDDLAPRPLFVELWRFAKRRRGDRSKKQT